MRRHAIICLLIGLSQLGCESEALDSSAAPSARSLLDPKADSLILHANQSIAEQRYDVAIDLLEQLDAEFPGLPEATFTWGRVHERIRLVTQSLD